MITYCLQSKNSMVKSHTKAIFYSAKDICHKLLVRVMCQFSFPCLKAQRGGHFTQNMR